MSSFFCNRDDVVKRLIKLRCQYADKWSRYAQEARYLKNVKIPTVNSREAQEDKAFLYGLFPSRKKWCSVGAKNNYRQNESAEYRNYRALWYTYCKAKKYNSLEQWYVDLNTFAEEIVKYVNNPNVIRRPRIIPTPKPGNANQFRPISSFRLKERVALSIVNKSFTELLDKQFLSCSYAFRARREKQQYAFMHLPAVLELQRFRQNHIGEVLYVAECDMKKFYDTISHQVITERFGKLLDSIQNINPDERKLYELWMKLYLDCYNFYEDVYLPSRDSQSIFWNNMKREKVEEDYIPWVEECEKMPQFQKKEIGVPQGGALSTLIANIVLHYVDIDVENAISDDPNMLYMRFCDDMILVGNDEVKTKAVFDIYQKAIRDSNLFAHPVEETKLPYDISFWEGKTRGPYMWGDVKKNHFPWVSFVGFECNEKGELRIRKSSFVKELKKQKREVHKIIKHVCKDDNNSRYNLRTLLGFVEKRLIAMSVGRINIRNYKQTTNAHSWMSAYSIIDSNKWSRAQMRTLDKHRRKMIGYTKKLLPKNIGSENRLKHSSRECLYHGKPFSYFGQCFTYKQK